MPLIRPTLLPVTRATRVFLAAALCGGATACVSRSDFREPTPTSIPPPRPAAPAASEAALPEVPQGPLGVHEAVALALARNPDLASASARVEAAAAALAQSEATLWPRLSADLTVLRSNAPSTYHFKTIDAPELEPGTDFNDPGTISNTEAGLSLGWNLYNGGRDQLAIWAAEVVQAGGRAQRAAVENALVAGVVAACLDVRAAGELALADEASVRTVEAEVEELSTRLAGGAALRSDLLSLEVRLAEARERKLRTELGLRLALATLRSLLALAPDQPLELSDEPFESGPPPSSLAEARAEAFLERPELEAARRAIERARLDEAAAERSWWPRLDVLARVWGGTNDLSLDLNDANATLMLSLGFDVFDGGARSAALDGARAALREVREADRRALIDVALDVEASWLRLEEARARLDVASQAVGASEETLQLVEQQFRGGSATVTRYLEAEAARTQARTALIRARLDLDRTQVDLARAVGRLGTDALDTEERG